MAKNKIISVWMLSLYIFCSGFVFPIGLEAKSGTKKITKDRDSVLLSRTADIYNSLLDTKHFVNTMLPYVNESDILLLKNFRQQKRFPRATVIGKTIQLHTDSQKIVVERKAGGEPTEFLINQKAFSLSIPLNLKKDMEQLENILGGKNKSYSSLFIEEAHAAVPLIVVVGAVWAVGAIGTFAYTGGNLYYSCKEKKMVYNRGIEAIISVLGWLPILGFNATRTIEEKLGGFSRPNGNILLHPKSITCVDRYPQNIEFHVPNSNNDSFVYKFENSSEMHVEQNNNMTLYYQGRGGKTKLLAEYGDIQNAREKFCKKYPSEELLIDELPLNVYQTAVEACSNPERMKAFETAAKNYEERVLAEQEEKSRREFETKDVIPGA